MLTNEITAFIDEQIKVDQVYRIIHIFQVGRTKTSVS